MLAPLIRILSRAILQPMARWYLKKDRWYSYAGIKIKVLKGVFHPGIFFSTRYLLDELLKLEIKEKNILELGAGSGLISFACAKNGANVTATDINPQAIRGLHENKEKLGLEKISIIQSDLFENLPYKHFHYIIINPPYYPRNPASDAEKAWYCGEHFEYFDKLFKDLQRFMQPGTEVWMSLSGDCHIERIKQIASAHSFELELRSSKRFVWEIQMIYVVKSYI